MEEASDMKQCSMSHEGIVCTSTDAAALGGMKKKSEVGSDITVRNTTVTIQTEFSMISLMRQSASGYL